MQLVFVYNLTAMVLWMMCSADFASVFRRPCDRFA